MTPKCLLLLSGLDPTGGAGLQADIQVASAYGIHPLPCLTINTIQNSTGVERFFPVEPAFLDQQLRVLSDDISFHGVKIGAVGTPSLLEVIGQHLRSRWIPVVVDPVLSGGGGGFLSSEDYADFLFREILPGATLVTPNRDELFRLTGIEDQQKAVSRILKTGARYVLVTGGDSPDSDHEDEVVSHLYEHDAGTGAKLLKAFSVPRVSNVFHGTGCTLSTALACEIVRGNAIEQAVTQAERYVSEAIQGSYALGAGQNFLDRMNEKAPLNGFS